MVRFIHTLDWQIRIKDGGHSWALLDSIDAYYSKLYGLTEEELRYILDSQRHLQVYALADYSTSHVGPDLRVWGLTFIFYFLPQRAISDGADGEAVHLWLGHKLLNSNPIVL